MNDWARIVDCGDARLTVLDSQFALGNLTQFHRTVSSHQVVTTERWPKPRILTLGGDHATTLPALRSAYERWGKITVIHFDSHLGESSYIFSFNAMPQSIYIDFGIDTWEPSVLGEIRYLIFYLSAANNLDRRRFSILVSSSAKLNS